MIDVFPKLKDYEAGGNERKGCQNSKHKSYPFVGQSAVSQVMGGMVSAAHKRGLFSGNTVNKNSGGVNDGQSKNQCRKYKLWQVNG